MNNIDISKFKRIIADKEAIAVPTMPILIDTKDGCIWETDSIRGAVSIVIGDSYLHCNNEADQWHQRLMEARKQSMFAISRNVFAKVHDSREGMIRDNYAVDDSDPDYLDDPGKPILIRIENDKSFLLSLLLIGAVEIFERIDSYQLRPLDISLNQTQDCNMCVHKDEVAKYDGIFCPVYNSLKDPSEGTSCSSFAYKESSKKRYSGGEYIYLSEEYDINSLIECVKNK